MSYNIYFNNKSNEDLGIEVIKRPFIPIPKRKIKIIDIEGHDGNYYVDEEAYEDIVITIEFNFVENDLYNIRIRVRQIKKWLDNINNDKLILSDDPEYFFKVCKIESDDFNYENLYKIQQFNVNFICKPHQCLLKGQKEIKVNGVLFNHWDICKPTYRIVGNGNCVLNVNGTIVNCNVSNELIINTEFDKILNADNTLAVEKTDIKAMQDLYLIEGKNNITITNGFKLCIKPNYRTI
ncbi:phage tail protein [Clostridium botulinum]|nr:phage tail protein [Clostridium botulinum]